MKKDSRKVFFDKLMKLAEKDKKLILIVCDLGFSFMEEFAEKFPKQFINAGIAEQNAIGIATGLKIAGYNPYVYSGAVFINYRCIEQIRDAWFQGIDIKVVGTGASGFLGFTHNFQKGEREPLKYLKGSKNYIKL